MVGECQVPKKNLTCCVIIHLHIQDLCLTNHLVAEERQHWYLTTRVGIEIDIPSRIVMLRAMMLDPVSREEIYETSDASEKHPLEGLMLLERALNSGKFNTRYQEIGSFQSKVCLQISSAVFQFASAPISAILFYLHWLSSTPTFG